MRTSFFTKVGAGIAIGVLVAAPPASASVEGFILEMDTPFALPAEQLTQGTSFCSALARGREQQISGSAAAAIIINFNNDKAFQGRASTYVTKLMIAAVKELCPTNRDFFVTAARAYDAQTGE